MLKLCKSCFTMKNIAGKKIICKKCEMRIDKKNMEKENDKQ
jgi:hypothetical protein